MIKEAPSLGRILAMVVFSLSVFGLAMFLWLAFGGSIPLRPEGYRLTASVPEAATLAVEADVRIAGVNVGKVKSKELDAKAGRTTVEMELKPPYSPIPKDSHAILRQKTLLGETYIELSTGDKTKGMLDDGARLANTQVEPTTELDEIFSAFDKPTRDAFQEWVSELRKAISGGAGQDLNDVLGNIEGFSVDGAKLLGVLDEQEIAVRRLVKNTGVVFGAINEREGALGELIVNANNVFEATASRDEALAETFRIFPTFLDESKVTLARIEDFSIKTRPLINELKGPADDLGPTVRDIGDLAPDLERLFRDLDTLTQVGRTAVPDLERLLREGEPLFAALHPFLQELNPILSFLNFHQGTVAGFISNAIPDLESDPSGQRQQTNIAIIGEPSFERHLTRPDTERGNAYMAPNGLQRAIALGTIESFDCKPSGGEVLEPDDANGVPPCLVAPPSLFGGQQFSKLDRGVAPNRRPPGFREGSDGTAVDPHPNDPLH